MQDFRFYPRQRITEFASNQEMIVENSIVKKQKKSIDKKNDKSKTFISKKNKDENSK